MKNMHVIFVVLQSLSYGAVLSEVEVLGSFPSTGTSTVLSTSLRTTHHALITHIFYHLRIKKQFPEVPISEIPAAPRVSLNIKKQYTMKYVLFLLMLPLPIFAQVGSVQFIDSSTHSTGISNIEGADINNNGDLDLIASFTGSNGKLAYYINNDGKGFSDIQIIDSISFLEGVASGDFNNDGWRDLLAIGGIQHEVFLYLNDNGTFSSPVVLDSNISIALNDIEVADFDGNGTDDFVVIGQHSIDFHRNMGNATFSKEEILTTSTSPRELECLDLEVADLNADGHQDLVCAETAGLVIYLNSGNGEFTPHYYSTISEIGFLAHLIDMDGDDDQDVLMYNSFGELKWFSNNGKGEMTFESVVLTSPDLHSIACIDYDEDGREDIYATYLHNVSVFLNDDNHSFLEEESIYQDSALYMDAISLFDVDNDGRKDYLWSGTTRSLAYHINLHTSAVQSNTTDSDLSIYPNPAHNYLSLDTHSDAPLNMEMYNSKGERIQLFESVYPHERVDVSHLLSGAYFLKVTKGQEVHYRSIIVQ